MLCGILLIDNKSGRSSLPDVELLEPLDRLATIHRLNLTLRRRFAENVWDALRQCTRDSEISHDVQGCLRDAFSLPPAPSYTTDFDRHLASSLLPRLAMVLLHFDPCVQYFLKLRSAQLATLRHTCARSLSLPFFFIWPRPRFVSWCQLSQRPVLVVGFSRRSVHS